MVASFKKYEWLLAILLFGLFWFGLTYSTGTINSGFHLVDDHQMLKINYQLYTEGSSFFYELGDWIADDFAHGRLRPVYNTHLFIETAILHTNFLYLSILAASLAVAASIFLYFFARGIGLPITAALVFVSTILIGQQSAIWWRLGPNETIGMFWLSLSLLLFVKWSKANHDKNRLYQVLSTVSLLLAAWSKESFLLAVPGFLFLNIYLHQEKVGDLRRVFKKTFWINALLLIAFMASLVFILTSVGTDKMGYAGVDSFHPVQWVKTLKDILLFNRFLFIVMIGLFLIFVVDAKDSQSLVASLTSARRRYFLLILAIIWIVASQAFLYAKSGIVEVDRYVLPATLGNALVILLGFKYMQEKKLPYWRYVFMVVVIAYLSIPVIGTMVGRARIFASEGKTVGAITEAIRQDLKPGNGVIFWMENSEYSFSLYKRFFYSLNHLNMSNCYPSTYKEDVKTNCVPEFDPRLAEIRYIIVFPVGEEQQLTRASWFDGSKYNRSEYGQYLLYHRK